LEADVWFADQREFFSLMAFVTSSSSPLSAKATDVKTEALKKATRTHKERKERTDLRFISAPIHLFVSPDVRSSFAKSLND